MASQFQFVMRSGPTPGATFSLEGDQLTIGRDSSNGVSINDAEVSRKHARLTFQGGKYVIEDLGSTNGTFVNGQRLSSSAVLKSGDVVSLGEQIVLLFETLSVDPGATMASPRKARATAAPAPAPAAPMPAPAQNYAGQAPAGPARKSPFPLPILIGAGVLALICVCGGFIYWVDATYRWCVFFPFLSGCG
jgi:pSer/pThr/pTyr-binding forkhead associated (FHA) protein